MSAAPPLPSGWTEHSGPNGVPYYFNTVTQESTYIRPVPVLPFGQTSHAQTEKERPAVKTHIPGTDWVRVKTTAGNVFYSNKVTKKSLWTVPEEIQDAVALLDKQVKPVAPVDRKKAQEQAEIDRIKAEVEEATKRKADDTPDATESAPKKRKVEVEDVEEEDSSDDDDEPEEEWQKEAAAQLAVEAEVEAERQRQEELERAAEEAREKERKKEIEKLNLSIEEGKAMFKMLLREKDINPMLPWDNCLPQFVSDPRYLMLPNVTTRREAFDDYCRERAREIRAQQVLKDKVAANPKEEFDRLLSAEVKSTRTSWSDFRRAWKKDRRFYGWGRDDREREKRFREYLKELGERKRAAAEKAEADFFALLKENGPYSHDVEWKNVKRNLTSDPRYDAVGSSSLREELFKTYLKANGETKLPVKDDSKPDDAATSTKESKEERRQRAVREREQRVKADRERVEAHIDKSKHAMNQGEGELEFRSLLTDAIREPQATWDASLPQLEKDPRFQLSTLPRNQQIHLFHAHISHLRAKHLASMHAFFETHAPSLATTFRNLPVDDLLSSHFAAKLGYDERTLEKEFDVWQRERSHAARLAFDEMLKENSFVEFWGRLGKIGGEGVEGGVKQDDEGMAEDEGEFGGGRVDMKALAKSVDVGEIEKVLRNDKRYIMFDHVPDQRERWLRDYLSNLSAPKLSVHNQTS